MNNIAHDISVNFHSKVKVRLHKFPLGSGMNWFAFDDVDFYGTQLYHDILDQQMFIGWWKLYQNN